MALAIFDLDDTLIEGSSDEVWEDYLIEQGLLDADTCYRRREYFHYHYYRGTLDIRERQRSFLQSLKQFSLNKVLQDIDHFVVQRLHRMVKKGSRPLLEKHQTAGDNLIVVSAASCLIAEPIASYLGIENVLATVPEIEQGHITGEIAGIPCFREGKVTRLEEWMLQQNKTLDGSFFYADSTNDLPLLEMVNHPVVIDPEEELERIAKKNKWLILSLK